MCNALKAVKMEKSAAPAAFCDLGSREVWGGEKREKNPEEGTLQQ
jgi:hypothetical protein